MEDAVKVDACRRLGFDIVRRITGGRAVLHRNELTYSVISRIDNPLFPRNVHGTYKVIAEGLLAGLRNLGISAEIVSRTSRHANLVETHAKDPACFSSPSWYEIVVNGKKIVGSAQRRLSNAFLQHGSILIDYDPLLEAAVIPGAGTSCGITSIQQELNRNIPLGEIKQACKQGFQSGLEIDFQLHDDPSHRRMA
jgi:lipoate-protein ligase A